METTKGVTYAATEFYIKFGEELPGDYDHEINAAYWIGHVANALTEYVGLSKNRTAAAQIAIAYRLSRKFFTTYSPVTHYGYCVDKLQWQVRLVRCMLTHQRVSDRVWTLHLDYYFLLLLGSQPNNTISAVKEEEEIYLRTVQLAYRYTVAHRN